MAAALEHSVHERGIPALGIWAQVPHYVATMSYPAASVALLDGLATATGVAIDAADLRREAVLQRERLDQLSRATRSTRRWSPSSSGSTTPPSVGQPD